jgi:sugar lactone lactonase YvrE
MDSDRSCWVVVSMALCATCITLAAGCTGDTSDRDPGAAAPPPQWSFDPAMVFPADGSLALPEDGIALPDGRLIVTDQVHGLRLVATDGTSAPFGDLAGAGYVHRPPDHNGGANGISLEPGGTHLLLTDGHFGEIYRVDVASGATELVYRHPYGVNSAVRDSRGAIWFTQSTANPPEAGEARMWAAVDVPIPDGALLRLASRQGRLADTAEVIVDSLLFANGLVIDEQAGQLYIGETTGNRVLRFRVDLASGRVSERSVFAEIAADNVELDGEGQLWVVSPLTNEVVVINTATGQRHTAFRVQSPKQQEQLAEFLRRGETGAPRLELLTPDLWAPLPGFITGVIVGPGRDPVYLTGLGNALVKLTR